MLHRQDGLAGAVGAQAADDGFGRSVALDGDTLVVGARQDEPGGAQTGSAYVFTRRSGGWSELTKLTALDGSAEDYSGTALAMDGAALLVLAMGQHHTDN